MVHARARMRTSTCTGGGTTVRGTHANGQERAGVRARAALALPRLMNALSMHETPRDSPGRSWRGGRRR